MQTTIVGAEVDARRPTDLTPETVTAVPVSATPLIAGFQGVAFAGTESVVIGIEDRPALVVAALAGLGEMIGSWWGWRLPAVSTETPVPKRERTQGTSALDAADALAELFALPMETVAAVTGIGRTTIIHWRRTGAVPRPSTVGGLWRLYGLAMTLKAVLGTVGTRSWLRTGSPSPLDLIQAGDIETLEQHIARLAFDPRRTQQWRPGVLTADELDSASPATAEPPMASRRHVRRARLG